MHFSEQFFQGAVGGVCDFYSRVFKTFVMALVSLPKYVNLDQCVFSVLFLCFLELDIDLRTDVLYPLLCRISCIILLSFSLFSWDSW